VKVDVTSATLLQHWAGKGLSINDALDLGEVVKDYFFDESNIIMGNGGPKFHDVI